MIIDSHTHVDKFWWFSPPETIVGLMDEAGIQQCVIMTYGDEPDVEGSMEYIVESIQKYPDRLFGYLRVNPYKGKLSQSILRKGIEDFGLVGLKLHPVDNLCHPSDPHTIDLIRVATEYNAPTLFHCGDEEYTFPLQIGQAAAECPDSIIILGHSGGYFHTNDAIRVAERHPNVYLDTSCMPYPKMIKEAVSRIGASRVLFASDGPGCNPRIEVQKIKMAGLTPEEEEAVFYKNIKRILDNVSVGGAS